METFADLVVRESFRPKTLMQKYTSRPLGDLRQKIVQARKFVLDESMSEFMAELSHAPFIAKEMRRSELLDTLRHGAMLPHPLTWIEYDGRAFRRGLLKINDQIADAWGKSLAFTSEEDVPRYDGWLLEQHPQIETAIRMTPFCMSMTPNENEEPIVLPFTVVWNTADNPLPWEASPIGGMLAHGITGYVTPYLGTITDETAKKRRFGLQRDPEGIYEVDIVMPDGKTYHEHFLIAEFGGLARYAMAFLATLNDIPVLMQNVKQHRGYVARGQYRKFMDHTIVKLSVPNKISHRLLARRLIVQARRRAHSVRGHWRLFRKGPEFICNFQEHQWTAMNELKRSHCEKCSTVRTWIAAHQRGDAALGFVTHDYAVEHGRV